MNQVLLNSFTRDGFAVLPQLLDAGRLQALRDAVLGSIDPPLAPVEFEADVAYPGSPESQLAVGGQTPRRLLHAYGRDTVFRALASDPKIVAALQSLLDSDQVCVSQNHHNCVMTKMPGFSSETQWHQDIRYWRFDRSDLISVWVALGDERVENGALRMIPGSHQMAFDAGRLDAKLFLRQDLDENLALIETSLDSELNAGDAVLFHCRTFHAAGRNTTREPKLACVFTYHSADNLPIPGTRSSRFPSIAVS